MNILIIDSDQEVADYIEEVLLNTPGIDSPNTKRAAEAEEANNLLYNASPDLVITEMDVPGSDGITIISAFRQYNAQTPVIVITKELDADTLSQLKLLNIHSVFAKPLIPEYIHQAITSALNIQIN